MKKAFGAILLLFWSVLGFAGQPIFRIAVSAGAVGHTDLPVSIAVTELGRVSLGKIRLVEVVGNEPVEKPFQVVNDPQPRIYWKLEGITPAGSERVFELEKGKPAKVPAVLADKEKDDLVLRQPDRQPLLSYRYTEMAAPEGVNKLYARSGYIHPLRTPSGKVLTRIQPPDHYHHYGLWNPWTRVRYDGKQYDLWNLDDHKGTVRFVKFDQIDQGPISAGFDAVHDHVIYDGEQEENIIRENWKIQVFPVDESRYICDITSRLIPTDKQDVVLEEYRYGGLVLRATELWTNQNCDVQTSTGKTRKDADGSLERWSIVSGDLGGTRGGILFLSFPENYNFPEPIRVWPENENKGRGDLMFNISPIKNKEWILRASHPYTIKYRLLVFDGQLSPEEAESTWQSFAYPPAVSVQKL